MGVLHEKLGAADFQPFLAGPLYFDPDKIFFGPSQRRLGLLGFLRLDVWMNIYRYDWGRVRNVQFENIAWCCRSQKERGSEGNFKGDGTLLGGVYVVGPGDEVREEEYFSSPTKLTVHLCRESCSTTRKMSGVITATPQFSWRPSGNFPNKSERDFSDFYISSRREDDEIMLSCN